MILQIGGKIHGQDCFCFYLSHCSSLLSTFPPCSWCSVLLSLSFPPKLIFTSCLEFEKQHFLRWDWWVLLFSHVFQSAVWTSPGFGRRVFAAPVSGCWSMFAANLRLVAFMLQKQSRDWCSLSPFPLTHSVSCPQNTEQSIAVCFTKSAGWFCYTYLPSPCYFVPCFLSLGICQRYLSSMCDTRG